MDLSISSLAPPAKNGHTLRPRTPPGPKPGFFVQSPDSRVSLQRPPPSDDLPCANLDFDNPAFDPGETASDDSGFESVVEVTRAKDFLSMIPKKKKKKIQGVKPGSSCPKAKGRPRGSGTSVTLIRGPGKKPKKAVPAPVINDFNPFLSIFN